MYEEMRFEPLFIETSKPPLDFVVYGRANVKAMAEPQRSKAASTLDVDNPNIFNDAS